MAEAPPTIVFSIDFTQISENLPRDEATIINQISTWIPAGLSASGNIVRTQNGTFTLYGPQAVYFRNLVNAGVFPFISIMD